MIAGDEPWDARELLYGLRGIPEQCDFCLTRMPAHELHPEEGGDWVCRACMDRWDAEDRRLDALLADDQADRNPSAADNSPDNSPAD